MDNINNSNVEGRIHTFSACSSELNVNEVKLAKHGFAYDPTLQHTVCVGCGKIIAEWAKTDQPCNMRFHEEGCEFAQTISNGNHNNNLATTSTTNQSICGTSALPGDHEKFTQSRKTLNVSTFSHIIDHPYYNRQAISLPPPLSRAMETNTTNDERMDVEISTSQPQLSIETPLLNNSLTNPSREISLLQASGLARQQSSLIRPGNGLLNSNELTQFLATHDMRVAANRLKTFERFWTREIVFRNIRLLVMCGFYSLGQGDAVECFCCHVILANWSRDDNPQRRHRELSSRCRFIRGEECGDTPLPPQIRQSGRSRFRRSRHSIPEPSPTPSIVAQPSLEAVPERQDSPQLPQVYSNPSLAAIERTNLLLEFPCINPANSTMREEQARLRTLENPEFRRNTRLRASNERLAQAGMYYIGDQDRTKCWFCDGGLKDYLPDDDPWVEHAKYFPQCEYLLQQRGPGWVNSISVQNPDVERPILPSRERHILPNEAPTSHQPSGAQASSSFEPPPSTLVENPQQSLLNQAMRSAAVEVARTMGFSEELIREVQLRNINLNGSIYQTAESLVDALLNPNNAQNPENIGPQQPNQANTGSNVHSTPSGTVISLPGQTIHIVGGNFTGRTIINGRVVPPSSIYGSIFSGSIPSGSSNTTLINGLPASQYMNHVSNAPRNIHIEEGAGSNPPPSTNNGLAALGLDLPPSSPMVRMTRRNPSSSSASSTAATSSSAEASTSTPATSSSGDSQQRLAELERERICKICLTSSADILFQPCGHICSCSDCARRLYTCPVCRRSITRYIRTYHA